MKQIGLCLTALGLAAALLAAAPDAAALEAASVGLVAHDISFSGDGRERGESLEVEMLGQPLHTPDWLAAPTPYAALSLNMNGRTSYIAAGLHWRVRLSRRWAVSPGLGLAIHNGALHNRYEPGDPRAADYQASHALLGSRVLVRETIALERRIDDTKTLALVYEHLSNGGEIFGHRDNEGLNQLGLRLVFHARAGS